MQFVARLEDWQSLLAGGVTPAEKYESQLGLEFPRYGKKCSKPPTSLSQYLTKFSV